MLERGRRARKSLQLLAATLLLASLSALAQQQGRPATLEPRDFESNEGYYQLAWQAEEPVRLVESPGRDFVDATVLYSGTDTGHVVSGKPDGIWHYRLESADGNRVLSELATITVRHHSLERALLFFALGVVVFVATLGLIFFVRPDRDERA
ncbi:MAG TPA: hypothetical protein VMR74_10275 [Gammaproteobacteria bacterium]|nr:hypothetical protein [Gammaproteobacteria bacterium]